MNRTLMTEDYEDYDDRPNGPWSRGSVRKKGPYVYVLKDIFTWAVGSSVTALPKRAHMLPIL